MRTISATEAKQRFSALLNAARREPIDIRHQRRRAAVLISPEEYDRLREVAIADFQRYCDLVGRKAMTRGLTDEKFVGLLAPDD